jgi:hypothetical protein
MEVVTHSPLPVASVVWQSRPGAWVLTFVAKATFQLQPGKSTLAAAQQPIHEEDSHWDDDPSRSLYAASDLEPLKPRVDVVLVGSAFAPQGLAVRSLFARLILGEIDKSIEVHQDRNFTSEGSVVEGQRFSRMALSYERAAGGPDTTNPIGLRVDVRDAYGRIKLPNLQPPGLTASPTAGIPPVGFGPIPPTWPLRWSKLGRHAAVWSPQWLTAGPVPEDIDWSFFNTAPIDQQLPELPEDARLILENLNPQVPRFVTNFPALRPRAMLEGRGGHHPLKMRCDTLWIDTDQGIASMTFRGQIALERLEEAGRIIVTLEEASAQPVSTPAPQPAAPSRPAAPEAPPPPKRATTRTMIELDSEPIVTPVPNPSRPTSALPFLPTSNVQPIREERTYAGGGLPFASASQPPREERAPAPQPAGGLPFVPTGSWPAATPNQPPPSVPPSVPSSARSSSPGAPAPPSSAVPPVPQVASIPPVTPVPPIAVAPAVAPVPMPAAVPPAAVPPPPPVRAASGAAPSGAPQDSVWASGVSRAEVPAGQSIGQVVVSAATAASQTTNQDGASGVLGASNAAAGPAPAISGKRGGDKPSGAGLSSFSSGARASSRLDQREVLHLIWYQPDAVARICKVPVWRAILDEMEDRASDDDLDDPAPTKDPVEIEDTRDIFEILVRAASQDVDQLADELSSAVRPGGKFVPSLLLLAGELSFPFDERETLKAAVAVATPMAGADEGLKTAVREAREFLASPDTLCPGSIVDGYTTRIREAFQRGRRSFGPEALDQQVERALLEGRHYQKRQVLGMNAIRALLTTGTGSSSVRPAPVYLPEDLAKKLPLFQRFRTRLIVELYLQEDQYEPHFAALKALSLGRVQVPQERR